MKKEWNAPMMEELTIKATAWGRWPGDKNRGDKIPGGRGEIPGGRGEIPGNSDVCHCYGGTSPCQTHHDKYEDPEEKTS